MPTGKYAAYKHAAPYFDLVRAALGDLVEGAHFFDVVDNDVVFEVLYDLGWPRVIRGRNELMTQFRGYCEAIELRAADHLVAHKTDNGRVLVIEYEVHGTILASGVKYNNRFCSIIHIENRKVTHWRDYMDSLAASNALSA
jgi:ketosteroid isomerase-like protein